MAKSIESILAMKELLGIIHDVADGLPEAILPAGMLTPTRTIQGNTGSYTRVNGTRQTARIVQYGAPSVKRNLSGISEQPITLLHSFEHVYHKLADYANLRSENSFTLQSMGIQTIRRQIDSFARLFRNLRVSAAYSALALGHVYFDGDGNLLPTATGAVTTIDFSIPAGNLDQLDILGEGDILDAAWATAGTDIIGQIEAVKVAAIKKSGYPLTHAFYGSDIPGLLMGNTAIRALVAGSPSLSEAYLKSPIPQGLLGLQWHPASTAFFEDADGVVQSWFDHDKLVFTPEPSPEWWEVIEGTYAIHASNNIYGSVVESIADVVEMPGMFTYAEKSHDAPGIKHYGGDTFLTVIKVPTAVMVATVP